MKLLQIDSSARTSSVTRRLTAKFAEEWRKNHPDGVVIQRDLSATANPLITDDWNATHLEQSKLTPAQQSYLSTSDELIEELEAADTVVIGAPMYNFTIPSSLISMDRSDCAAREDGWLRSKRPAGPSHKEESGHHHFARECL
jgi:FMN-dependent NADH-azoreductase